MWELMTWWFWVCNLVEANFLSGVFSPLTSAEACEKSSLCLWKESCVITVVRRPGITCVPLTSMIWTYLLKWREIPIQPITKDAFKRHIEAPINPKSSHGRPSVMLFPSRAFGIHCWIPPYHFSITGDMLVFPWKYHFTHSKFLQKITVHLKMSKLCGVVEFLTKTFCFGELFFAKVSTDLISNFCLFFQRLLILKVWELN